MKPSPRWAWPLGVLLASCVPVIGALSSTHVFHVRDLGLFFWPRHLWLRQQQLAGQIPLWDPYAGAGQSVVADGLNHLFFPVAILLRFLPEVVGFNLWVALPLPVAALGVYVLLRDRLSRSAAALGGLVFAASGPVVSSANFPNFSWAVALMPWVLWAAGRMATRPERRIFVLTAILVGLQALAGEPMTLLATGVTACAWLIVSDGSPSTLTRVQVIARFGAATGVGLLLAAVQLAPLAWAAAHSSRGDPTLPSIWSLHPLSLFETVVPHLFGDSYRVSIDRLHWLRALNNDREPLLFSLYVGIGALALGGHGALKSAQPSRRWVLFWTAITLIAAIVSLGAHTPVYPALQALVPPLQALRFPVKYLVVSMLGLAVLAAAGWENLRQRSLHHRTAHEPRLASSGASILASGVSLVAAAVVASMALTPAWSSRTFVSLAASVGVPDTAAAAVFMAKNAAPLFVRLLLLAGGVGLLLRLAVVGGRESRFALIAVFGVATFDPLFSNAHLHPTMPASLMGPPRWTAALPTDPDGRIYIGGKLNVPGRTERVDAVENAVAELDVEISERVVEARTLVSAAYVFNPSTWGLREVLSYDLPELRPKEYRQTLRRFAAADREARLRFLDRVGVRYCLLPEPPEPAARPLAHVELLPQMRLYTCGSGVSRALIVPEARIEPDVERQLSLLLSRDFDVRQNVLLDAAPPAPTGGVSPSASSGTGQLGPGATVLVDEPEYVLVKALVGAGGGYLTLLDSYDSGWHVRVDGAPAELLRANALFRAVRLSPGEHVVEFHYRPIPLYVGIAVSLCAGLVLVGLCRRPRRRRVPGETHPFVREIPSCQ